MERKVGDKIKYIRLRESIGYGPVTVDATIIDIYPALFNPKIRDMEMSIKYNYFEDTITKHGLSLNDVNIKS